MHSYDAILILGGGVTPQGSPPAWVQARLERGLEIASHNIDAIPILCLSAGTPHRPPPLDSARRPILESVACCDYLIRRGYPRHLALPESASYDTLGSAYFSRVIHTDPAELRRLAIVTSDFHMPRTQAIFDWIFSIPGPGTPYHLTYHSVPDVGLTAEALHVRRAKEARSLAQLHVTASRHATLRDVHRFLFTQHTCYASGLGNAPAEEDRQAGHILLKTY